jgi:hypothetical protein
VGKKGQQPYETAGDGDDRGIAVDTATAGVWTTLAEAEAHAGFNPAHIVRGLQTGETYCFRIGVGDASQIV